MLHLLLHNTLQRFQLHGTVELFGREIHTQFNVVAYGLIHFQEPLGDYSLPGNVIAPKNIIIHLPRAQDPAIGKYFSELLQAVTYDLICLGQFRLFPVELAQDTREHKDRPPTGEGKRRKVGFATEKSKSYKDALAIWESLVRDIQKGTPVWLDAKYHEVFCLLSLKKEKEAKSVMSSVLITYPKLGTPELEKKFLTMMKEKFSAKNYNELIKAREESLDESKVAKELKKKDEEALDALRPKEKEEDK